MYCTVYVCFSHVPVHLFECFKSVYVRMCTHRICFSLPIGNFMHIVFVDNIRYVCSRFTSRYRMNILHCICSYSSHTIYITTVYESFCRQ